MIGPMMSLRPIVHDASGRVDPAEYAMIVPWWQARDGAPPAREMLPGMGVIVNSEGEPTACGFMYLDATGSGVAQLAWLATRPGCSGKVSRKCLDVAVDFLTEEARRMNYWMVSATYHTPSLVRLLGRVGFEAVRTGMTQLFKPL